MVSLNALNGGPNGDALHCDFSKAFHTIDDDMLLRKPFNTGLGRHLRQWIRYFLTKRTQYVVVGGIP